MMSFVSQKEISKDVLLMLLNLFKEYPAKHDHICNQIFNHCSFAATEDNNFVHNSELVRYFLEVVSYLIRESTMYLSSNLTSFKYIFNFLLKYLKMVNGSDKSFQDILKYIQIILISCRNNELIRENGINKVEFMKTFKYIIDNMKFVSEYEDTVKIFMLDYFLISEDTQEECIPILKEILKQVVRFKKYELIFDITKSITDKKISPSLCTVIINFILYIGCLIYKSINDENVAQKIFACINISYKSNHLNNILQVELKEQFFKFIWTMTKHSHQICLWHCKNNNTEEFAKILQIIIEQFATLGNLILQHDRNVLDEILSLGRLIEEWPNFGNKIFFQIFHVLCHANRILWDPRIILEAIGKVIFSNTEFDVELFKSIIYIYPILLKTNLTNENVSIGLSILNKMSLCEHNLLTTALSYNFDQMTWISHYGSHQLRKIYVKFCIMKVGDQVNLISKAIVGTKTQSTLVYILMTSDDKTITKRCIDIVNEIKNEEMTLILNAAMLMADEDELHRILLCEPTITKNEKIRSALCTYFSLNIANITNENVLRLAIKYSRTLLGKCAKCVSVIRPFFTNTKTLQYLSHSLVSIDLETKLEVILFLKLLVCLQRQHKMKLEHSIYLEINSLIDDIPDDNISLSITFLTILLEGDLILKLHETTGGMVGIIQRIVKIYLNPAQSNKASKLILKILKKHIKVCRLPTITYFVEFICSSQYRCGPFNKVLLNYLQIIYDSSEMHLFHLPSKTIVERFISRADIPFRTKTKMWYTNMIIRKS